MRISITTIKISIRIKNKISTEKPKRDEDIGTIKMKDKYMNTFSSSFSSTYVYPDC